MGYFICDEFDGRITQMGRKIKDCDYYVNRIIKLESGLSRTMITKTSAEHRRHNRCAKELYRIYDELYDEYELASQVYSTLMKNEDPYIRQAGATECLILGILVEEAVPILEWCVENQDTLYSWGARRRLMIFRGKMPEDSPKRPPKWRNEE